MRVLVLGGNGMLGHVVCRTFADHFDVWATFREDWSRYETHQLVPPERALSGIDAMEPGSVEGAVQEVRPDLVINCIGIVKQREEAKAAIPSILVNSLLPHRLARLCSEAGIRLFHFSTDCVFSGGRGLYTEADIPDPVDLYGRSKLLGEVVAPGCLTLRTSIVGWELEHRAGLLEWFAAQRGRRIKGYRRAIYSGVSTSVMAGLVRLLATDFAELEGLYHVASEPIDKHQLLVRLRDKLGWDDIEIEPDDGFVCDRSMLSGCFEAATGWVAPPWEEMLDGLAADRPRYESG